jgi:hypothetical protein
MAITGMRNYERGIARLWGVAVLAFVGWNLYQDLEDKNRNVGEMREKASKEYGECLRRKEEELQIGLDLEDCEAENRRDIASADEISSWGPLTVWMGDSPNLIPRCLWPSVSSGVFLALVLWALREFTRVDRGIQ